LYKRRRVAAADNWESSAKMENTSSPSDVWNNITATSFEHQNFTGNIFIASNHALKVVHNVIGSVGILGNLFVIFIFVFFIKIADKVL